MESNDQHHQQQQPEVYDSDIGVEMAGVAVNKCVNTPDNSTNWQLLSQATYPTSPVMDITIDSSSREKRKKEYLIGENSDVETDDGDSKTTKPEDTVKKQNHSEIEKRRRDKMNTYITELSSLVPMCQVMARKLDKLTVLRMAVQHMKSLKGSINSYSEGSYKPSFLSDTELKKLILKSAEGFLFVVGCDRGRILYASQSVSEVLYYSQGDLLGQSWFDILHPKDIAKVKEQLSSSDPAPREKLIDAKTMLPVKAEMPPGQSRLCPGARRSFFCRIKCKSSSALVKEEADTTTGCHRRKRAQSSGICHIVDSSTIKEQPYDRKKKKSVKKDIEISLKSSIIADKKYCVVHCTGYLKSWAPAKFELEDEMSDFDIGEQGGCNLSCLVAVGRILSPPSKSSMSHQQPHQWTEFWSRHNIDGKFVYVDQRATLALGYLPQEMLGTSCYEYYHQEDVDSIANCHKSVMQAPEAMTTLVYRFRTKDGSFKWLQTKWKAFYNPWTKDIEYLEARNTLVPEEFDTNGKFLLRILINKLNNVFSKISPTFSSETAVVDSSIPSSDNIANATCNMEQAHQNYGQFSLGNSPILETRASMSKTGQQIVEEVLESQSVFHYPLNSAPPIKSSLSEIDSSLCGSTDLTSFSNIRIHSTAPVAFDTASFSQRQSTPFLCTTDNEDNCSSSNTSNTVPNRSASPMHFTGSSSNVDIVDPLIDPDVLRNTLIQSNSTEGNDEAAMAVIMSLLEADAGLGGPVDFSGLPWPLS